MTGALSFPVLQDNCEPCGMRDPKIVLLKAVRQPHRQP